MESTGVYWQPVFNVLEGQFQVWLVNARHAKAVPGRKTDVHDAEWLAQLLQHGLLRPNRLEHTNPNPYVTVAALYDGPANGDSFRYLMQPGGQFSQESLGELDMGDPQTLVNFVRWSQQFAPADYSYLAIADHFMRIEPWLFGCHDSASLLENKEQSNVKGNP